MTRRSPVVPALVAALLALSACSPSDSGGGSSSSDNTPASCPSTNTVSSASSGVHVMDTNASTLLTTYTQGVVVTAYNTMCDAADDLVTAVAALKTTPSDTNVQAARDAWAAVRAPWERSEAFLFGPVESNGIDPSVDTWPLDLTAVNSGLASSGSYGLTDDETKGFHAIEYALWNTHQDAATVAATFAGDSDIAKNLATIAGDLSNKAKVLSNAWVNSYGSGFIKSGQTGGNHVSQKSALEEIVNGMIGIADEVGTGKISDPVVGGDADHVESQFSYNSIADFHNNIQGIQAAYFGGYDAATPQANSLSLLVAATDATLDGDIKDAIQTALDAIDTIDVAEFHDGTPTGATGGAAAIAAVGDLFDILNDQLLPFVQAITFTF